ncbi:hypothetical protein KFZ56_00325 [Virgibacillus sp. NKC19-3]|uniref:hypothetical protein n=1 Tax=Virgibacillus saliphilus TaxID=2831674 RepID=UPI001C9A7F4D|nr:hypothetical protein [Virgibacillus sp. NKC19-3]MBY7141574.1 hypothetical protein [Virgibacillus sp. NKC19-3]
MSEKIIEQTKSQHPEILEIVGVEESENLVFGLTEKDEGKKSTVVAYKVKNGKAEFLNSVTAYWKDDYATLNITEYGSTKTVKTDFHKSLSNEASPQASACENAINILCGFGGVAACQTACRAIPVIGIILGFTICRNLCASIVGDGCDAAKNRFC